MNFATSRLKTSTFFSKAIIFSQMTPYMLSTFINFSLLGVRLRVIQSLIAMRVARQLSTIQFSSRYSSNFSPLRKMLLMVRLRLSSTNLCYLLTSSTSRDDYNFSSMSHQIKDCSQSDWMNFKICCFASRKIDILPILKLMIDSLGVWRRPQILMSRSSTAEWQICSCCVMVELIFLLNCCSTNSQIKLISLNYKPAITTFYSDQPHIHIKY